MEPDWTPNNFGQRQLHCDKLPRKVGPFIVYDPNPNPNPNPNPAATTDSVQVAATIRNWNVCIFGNPRNAQTASVCRYHPQPKRPHFLKCSSCANCISLPLPCAAWFYAFSEILVKCKPFLRLAQGKNGCFYYLFPSHWTQSTKLTQISKILVVRKLHQLAATMRRLILRIFRNPRKMQTFSSASPRQKRLFLLFIPVTLNTIFNLDTNFKNPRSAQIASGCRKHAPPDFTHFGKSS